jgi:signal transduction histidine kinase
MSIFVLGLLIVASMWIFEKLHALTIALFILILFDGGLHYFQTDPCKLFANYITGTCVSIFFVFISRVSFAVNYNHFIQLKKIEQKNQDITRINEMQTEILSVVAHDLRSPMTSIMGLTVILKNSETTIADRNEYFDMIIATCNRSNKIIDDLLTTARNEESDTNLEYICVNDLVANVVYQFSSSRRSGRQIKYELPIEKMHAYVDQVKMTRVFENLLGNAIKFTKDNGIITVTVSHDNDKVYIVVADNGIGIPEDKLPLLFSRFSGAGRTGVNGEKSYGLGMSICKLIIKQHYGDIAAYSEEGKWTQIKITLPQAKNFHHFQQKYF